MMGKLKYVFGVLVVVGAGVFWWVVAPVGAGNFSSGFEAGVINTDRWQLDKELECEIEIENEMVRAGQYAVRFEAGPEARCEVVPYVFEGFLGDKKREPYNEDRWYAFSVRLDGPWEIDDQNEVIAQWHSTGDKFFAKEKGRGPPLALRVIGGFWYLTYGWDADFLSEPGPKASHKLWYGELDVDEWVDWRLRVRWSWEDDGLIEVWKNDELLVRHAGPNTYNDIRGNYLKLGSYHPAVSRTIFLDNVYVGSEPPNAVELGNAQ